MGVPDLEQRPRPDQPSGIAIVAAVAVVVLAVFNLEIPYFAIEPGPAIDVVDMIDISSADTHEVSGRLLLTTVRLHEINVAGAIRGWLDPSYEVLSRSTVIPPDESDEEAEQRSTEQMAQSHQNAAAAALSYLGYEVKVSYSGVRVEDFATQAPARNVLRRGDIIIGADTATVKLDTDLNAVVQSHRAGDEIVLKVKRGDEELTLQTTTIQLDGETRIGVEIRPVPQIELPLAIDIDAQDIGGPSAGLMYAIGIVDLLDDKDIAARRIVAGTGEITIDGKVGPVGGVTQKLAGARDSDADLFLVPADEHDAACARAGDLDVYAVNDLADAIHVLSDPTFAASRSCQ